MTGDVCPPLLGTGIAPTVILYNNIVNNYYIKFINRRRRRGNGRVAARYTRITIIIIIITYNIISGPSFTARKCGVVCVRVRALRVWNITAVHARTPPGDRICRPRARVLGCVCVFKPLPRRNRVHRPSVCSFRERPRRAHILYIYYMRSFIRRLHCTSVYIYVCMYVCTAWKYV
jgi:hypothetical protein